MPDPTLPNPIEVIFQQQVARLLTQLLDAKLSPREAALMKLRFGIGTRDGDGKTRDGVAATFGLSAERCRQIEEAALSKLRKPHIFRTLRALL